MAITKCINHWADSSNFKGVTFNKHFSGLTGKCFEMPNASYTIVMGKLEKRNSGMTREPPNKYFDSS